MNRRHVALLAVPVLWGVLCPQAAHSAAAQEPEPPRQIHVNAQATVKATPDRAVIQLAVESLEETARAATNANAEAMRAVLAALADLDVPEERIQTARLELQPRYDRRRDAAEPEIVGYRAVNQVTVRIDDLDQVGPVVDAAVTAGANRVTGISFEISEPEAAYHDALRQAVAEARREAEVVADALGETLGPPIQVSTGGFSQPRPMMRAVPTAMDAMESLNVPPVQPGELDIQASVSITYRLDREP